MFDKFISGNSTGTFIKSSYLNQLKEKEMFDKMSRIQESYVDAAILAAKRKYSGLKSLALKHD